MLVNRRSWIYLVAVVVALATALSILHFIRSQAIVQQPAEFVGAMAVVGLAGGLAGICAYIVVRLVDVLAGRSLIDVLKGDEPMSLRWFYLAALGILLGAGIALFTHLALLLLSRLVSP